MGFSWNSYDFVVLKYGFIILTVEFIVDIKGLWLANARIEKSL